MSGTRWLALAFCLAIIAVAAIVIVIATDRRNDAWPPARS